MEKFKVGDVVMVRLDLEEASSDLTPNMKMEKGKIHSIYRIDREHYFLDIEGMKNTHWYAHELINVTPANKGSFTNVKE